MQGGGAFQLINFRMGIYTKHSLILWLHIFVRPGKTMIKVVFSLTILFYTKQTIFLFLGHQSGHGIDAKIL